MKVVVVGAGLQGLSAAKVLQQQGVEVEVLESRKGVGLETSYGNGGMLVASMSDPWNAPGVYRDLASSLFDPDSPMKLRWHAIPSLAIWGLKFLSHATVGHYQAATRANYLLSQYSITKTRELREQLGLAYSAGTLGTLKVFRDAEAMVRPKALAEMLANEGLAYKVMDVEQILELEPQLQGARDHLAGALYYPDDESGDSHQFCNQLAANLAAEGVPIRTGVSVERLLIEKSRVIGVKTSEGEVRADHVVVAAGVASVKLLKGTAVSPRIAPCKGYSITIDTSDCDDLPVIPVVDDAMHAAVTPFGSRLRAVGTAEFAGMDTRIEQASINELFELIKALYPHLVDKVDLSNAEVWAGLRPMSCDGKPFVGPTAIKGLYLNSGHGHLGWTMAVGSACLLADQILDRKPEIDPTPFVVHR